MVDWPAGANEFPIGDDRYALERYRPGSVEELVDLVARATDEGTGLYPQGGRTAIESGGIPARPGYAVDLTGLDRVVDYPAADMTITVEAGMTLARLQEILAAEGQRFNLEAPHADRATLGGIFATNTSGPRRFGLGRPRDLVIGISFVTSSHGLVKGGGRVVKNVAGYDFPRLLTGSFGALGIITQLTLKVRPLPESAALVATDLANIAEVSVALDALNTADTRPVAIELMNATAARAMGMGREAPWSLVLGFEGTQKVVDWQIERTRSLYGDVRVLKGEESGPVWVRMVDFQHPGETLLTVKANVPPSRVADLASRFDPSRWSVAAHAGTGIVWGHLRDGISIEEVVSELESARTRAVDVGGNLVLPRCPTAWKERLRVWGHPRADWALSDQIRKALDPAGVMNPGRFVGKI